MIWLIYKMNNNNLYNKMNKFNNIYKTNKK